MLAHLLQAIFGIGVCVSVATSVFVPTIFGVVRDWLVVCRLAIVGIVFRDESARAEYLNLVGYGRGGAVGLTSGFASDAGFVGLLFSFGLSFLSFFVVLGFSVF